MTPISWSQGLGYTETIISGTEKHLDKVEDDTIDEGPYPSGPCGCIFSSHREEAYEEHRVIMRLNEYLTALLRADALSLLAPLGALALCEGSAIIASYSLSPDEVTASVKKGDYGWRHPVPPRIPLRCDVDGGGPPCFRITWDRTFTPAVGAPVVTPMTYTWSGSTPEGYSETDKATWPKVSFSEEVPTDVGAVTISNVQYFCTGCE